MEIELKKDTVFNELKRKITTGEFKNGQKLKNELELSRDMKIAKKTLRSALSRLEEEGLVVRLRAKGTYISDCGGGTSKTAKKSFLVICPDEHPVYMSSNYILPGIENKISELGYSSLYCPLSYVLSRKVEDFEKKLKDSGITGIIYCSNYFHGNEKILQVLKNVNLPCVIPHTSRLQDQSATGFAIQFFNERESFLAGIKHLAEQGHCKMASLMHKGFSPYYRGFPPEEYFSTLKNLGLDPNPELLKIATYDPEEIKKTVIELVSSCAPTAIMCYSDFYAIHVYEALNSLSLKIPEDVAVMGYCGYPGGWLLKPSLSTVDLQYSEIGKSAVELIARADEWFGVKSNVAVPVMQTPYKLVIRESTSIKRIEKNIAGVNII